MPVVMFWHGGAWRRGDKDWHGALYGNVGVACARAGFVGIVCNYRLQPMASSWREQVDDVAAAVGWASRSADKFGGDPSSIFLAGHSAGAHLVSSLLSDSSALDANGVPPEKVAETVRGAVLMAGVYDVPRLARLPLGGIQIARNSFGERGDGGEWAAGSPSKVVRALGRRASDFASSVHVSPRDAAREDAAADGAYAARLDGTSGSVGSPETLAAASLVCPLLSTPTLVVNAKDDFHLDGDGASLVRNLRVARAQLGGAGTPAALPEDDADTDDEQGCAESWWEEGLALPGSGAGIDRYWNAVAQRWPFAGQGAAGGEGKGAEASAEGEVGAADAARRTAEAAASVSTVSAGSPGKAGKRAKGGGGGRAEGSDGSDPFGLGSIAETWQRWNVDPDRLATSVSDGLRLESDLLRTRIRSAKSGRVVRSYDDRTAVPTPLLEWEWLVPSEDGASAEPASGRAESEAAKARIDAKAAERAADKRAPRPAKQRRLQLHEQQGTHAVWGQADHRNHVTLVALIGQEGDPTTGAMLDFVRHGSKRASSVPQGEWDDERQ